MGPSYLFIFSIVAVLVALAITAVILFYVVGPAIEKERKKQLEKRRNKKAKSDFAKIPRPTKRLDDLEILL